MKATAFLSAVIALVASASAQQYRVELQRDTLSQKPVSTLGQPTAGDIDGDGLPDLVFFGPRIFRNRGNHFEEVAAGVPATLPDLGAPVLLDVDGDGDLDMVHRSLSGSSLHLLLNDGKGRFSDTTDAHMPSIWTFGTPSGADVDADGDLDLLLPSGRVLINDGRGVFVDETETRVDTTGFAIGDSVAVDDFDDDGDLDFVIMSGLHRNNGRGFFRLDQDEGLSFGYGETVFTSDFDHDGDMDLLTVAGRLIRNDQGHFTELEGLIPAHLTASWALAALADVDGDGADDLIATPKWQLVGEWPAWVRNNGDGTFDWSEVHAPSHRLPVHASRIASPLVADLDVDGDLDLVTRVRFALRPEVSEVVYNDGAGHWHNATDSGGLLPPRTYGRKVADLDGDGLDDIVNDVSWHRNDGTGSFTLEFFGTGGPNAAHAIADVNGDGLPDLLDRQSVWHNTRSGQFVLATQLLTGTDWVRHAVAIDVDSDGDLDYVAVAAPYGGAASVRVFVNDGTGHFSATSSAPSGLSVSQPLALACADFDGDGDRDLAISVAGFFLFGGEPVLLFANDGAGTFIQRPMPATSWVASKLQVADFEGDGDLDFVTQSSNLPILYVNDGTGSFTGQSLGTQIGNRFYLDDSDGDGDVDLWTTGHPDGWIRLFVNDGSNGFSFAPERFDASRPGNFPAMELVLVDFEGDGDRDVVAIAENVYTSTQMAVPLWNHRRHLRVPYLTEVGGSLEAFVSSVEVEEASSLAFVFVSDASANVPLGTLGVLGVDPGAAIVQSAVIPAGTETVPVAIDVPAAPSLQGLSVFAQALFAVGGELRLSGTLERTITN